MFRSMIDAILRHVVTFLGGAQFFSVYWDGAVNDAVVGVVLAVSGVVMSLLEKSRRSSSVSVQSRPYN